MLPRFQPLPLATLQDLLRNSNEEKIALGGFRNQGACWQTFDVAESDKVAKLVRLIDFPVEEDVKGSLSQGEIRHGVYREISIIEGPLKNLQGKVIPRCHGPYAGTRTHVRYLDDTDYEEWWLFMVENAGECLHGTLLSDEDCKRITSKYHALHKAGVLHCDVEIRHWFRTPSGDIRLINFDRAKSVGFLFIIGRVSG
ncbi:hypothetical protein L198_00772 [Cryptococcus wingfieldii CBS 7118]|uniref:Protein kinase domain-containing protein n=1 Tax=Cryptococcus wingfieldii CBS 7118 TaxID=1295528 RepID=A0A1E3K2H5_9TREE|nr:hypothetical protein L198_00772 [Cryptococcus wingfieldii CBS 7118]ODO07193.1 hypothetical protein L198_00772 [Cryptococcus wingfieldii CBS 7118]